MVTSRGAFFLSASLIISVAMFIYGPQIGKLRYLTVPTNQGLFILDTKNQMMNVCTDKACHIVPHETPGGMPGMHPTYGQMQMMPTNSLGVIDNSSMPMFGNGMNGMYVVSMPQMPLSQPEFSLPQQPTVAEKPAAAETVASQPPQHVEHPQAVIPVPQPTTASPAPVVAAPVVTPPPPAIHPQQPIMRPMQPVVAPTPLRPQPLPPQTPPQAITPQPQPQLRQTPPNPTPEQRIGTDIARLQTTQQALFGR